MNTQERLDSEQQLQPRQDNVNGGTGHNEWLIRDGYFIDQGEILPQIDVTTDANKRGNKCV